jgi:hypothetical protein
MKYTRYDFKRKKSDNTVLAVVLAIVLLLAFFIGTVLSNIIIKKEVFKNILPQSNSDAKVINSSNNKTNKFIVIQGGKFMKVENLEQEKKILINYGNPFTIEEQDGTRILLGIYNEEESLKIIKKLKDNNIHNSKIIFDLQTQNNLCDEEIAAIINAELEIINKLSDKTIKSIQTDELKKWCVELKEIDSKSSNITILNDLKTHINELPKDLTLDKTIDIDVYIYKLLKKTTNK